MRLRMRVVLLFATLGIAAISVAQTQNPAPATFSILISTPQSVVKAGSDVRLEITMTNMSGQTIYYAIGDVTLFDIDVRDAQDKLVPETPLGLRIHDKDPRFPFQYSAHEPIIRQMLSPGKSFRSIGTLSKIYDLSKPGKYTIQVSRVDPETKVLVKSNVITITITP